MSRANSGGVRAQVDVDGRQEWFGSGAVRPMAAMRAHLLLLLCLLLVALANGQRRRPPQVRMGAGKKDG